MFILKKHNPSIKMSVSDIMLAVDAVCYYIFCTLVYSQSCIEVKYATACYNSNNVYCHIKFSHCVRKYI